MRSTRFEVHEPLLAIVTCAGCAWCFGLAVCWIDIELGSRWMLKALPDPVLELADALWGCAVNIYAPFQGYCIF